MLAWAHRAEVPLLERLRFDGVPGFLAEGAAQGRKARIVLKMNALTDQPLMQALLRAGQRGVRIDLARYAAPNGTGPRWT